MKLRIDPGVHEMDLTPYAALTPSRYLTHPAGEEHYKLLAYLSAQLPAGSLVADLGTFQGASALALAYNRSVEVKSYDLENRSLWMDGFPPNVKFFTGNALEHVADYVNANIVMLDVDPHDGKQEAELYWELRDLGFKGLLLCDDINLNENMKTFWYEVTSPYRNLRLKNYDLTPWGHWSGTGIVVFDPEFIDVEVEVE